MNKIAEIVKEALDDINYDKADQELQAYLYEKALKAIDISTENNYSEDDIKNFIKHKTPELIRNYKNMKIKIDNTKEMETRFGCSINYQLIDLFTLADKYGKDGYYNAKEVYFSKYKKNKEYIFPGVEEASYETICNIKDNYLKCVDSITPEAEAKMNITIRNNIPLYDEDGNINGELFNFYYLDNVVNFAKKHNMDIKLHTLVWHDHFPKVLENASSKDTYQFLDKYFETISNRYKDTFYAVDVINEIAAPIDSLEYKNNEYLRKSKWRDKLGDSYYIEVLKLARKHFKNSELIYNEYDETDSKKHQFMLKIVDNIKKEEMFYDEKLLDTVGFQAHYNEKTLDKRIKSPYKDFINRNLNITVSEVDVSTKNNYDNKYNVGANRVFRTVLDSCVSNKVTTITSWGPGCGFSWKKNKVVTFLNSNGKVNRNFKKIVNTYSSKNKRMFKNNSNNKTISSNISNNTKKI